MTTRHTGPGPTRQHIRTAKDKPRIEVVERTVHDHTPVRWPAIPAGVATAALIELLAHLL